MLSARIQSIRGMRRSVVEGRVQQSSEFSAVGLGCRYRYSDLFRSCSRINACNRFVFPVRHATNFKGAFQRQSELEAVKPIINHMAFH